MNSLAPRVAATESPMRVLLLEDSPLDADLIREHVSRAGPPVVIDHVGDRKAFEGALRDQVYDAILADYVLPGFSGDAALDIARVVAPQTPFIFVSGTLGEDVAVEALKRGATDYVLKSRLQRLPSALARAVAEARERVELAETEQALRASEAWLRLALEAGRLGTWEMDARTGRLLRTDYFGRLFGYGDGQPEWTRETLLSHVHPEDREALEREFRHAAAANYSQWHAQCRIRRAGDGETRWVEFSGGPAPGDGGRLSGIVADITERKSAETAQRLANETLERRVAERTEALAGMVNRLNAEILQRERTESALLQALKMDAIGQMTGGVAHDFNNLLTILVSHLDLIQHSAGDSARVRQLAAAALNAADRGVRLTGHLLAFARRQALRPETVGVNRLIRDFEPLVRRALGEAVELILELDPDAGSCHVDPTQFEVAMLNLAVNARDAMGEGGRLTMRTTRRRLDGPAADAADLEPGSYVEVAIADTGPGIPADIIGRVFEPFFTTKGVGRGSGLGLSQVYGFARQSGGNAVIESEPGAGTRVALYLPCAAGEAAEQVRANPAEGTLQTGRGELVLVVEDDELVRAATTEALGELGYRVAVAADGAQALAALERERPDILFTDLVMPGGVSGLQLIATARRRWPDLPILMTSGYTAPDTSGDLADVSAGVPLLSKPYRRATLAQELRGLLDAAPEPSPPPPANVNEADGDPTGSGPTDGLRVLLVEDESLIRMACSDALIELGHFVEEAGDGPEALAALDAGRRFDVLMTDVGLPGMRGTELARLARERFPGIWVVYVTGQAPGGGLDAEPRTLVLSKPYRREDLEQTLRRVSRT